MRLPARRWLAWPAAAVCLIGIGGIAALDLSRTNRPVAAFALAMEWNRKDDMSLERFRFQAFAEQSAERVCQ